MTKHKKNFRKSYFTDYYKGMTGEFENADLEKNRNWFFGWFNSLLDWYDFRDGKNKKALEVGCAIGAASRILAERGFEVIASDISEYAVNNSQKVNQHQNLSFTTLDVETSKKFSKTFDLIFGFEVIEHLEHPEKAIKNLKRMLKPGGVLICSTPFPFSYVFVDKTHVNVKHPLDWQRILLDSGFSKVTYKKVAFLPLLYRFSKYLHLTLPFCIPWRYINSTVFFYAQKLD